MILISVVSIIVALLFTLVVARFLYKFSLKRDKLNKSTDYILNGVILAFVFFCISSFIYVILLNII